MKLSGVIAKLTGKGSKALGVVGGLLVAGAAATAMAPAAQGQVAFGVQIGTRYAPRPVYVAPAPAYGYGYGYGVRAYDEHRRFEDLRAREWRDREFRERQRWDDHHDWNRDRGFAGRNWR